MNNEAISLPKTGRIFDALSNGYLLIVFLGIIMGILVLRLSLKLTLSLLFGIPAFLLIAARPDIGFLLTVGAIPFDMMGVLLPEEYIVSLSLAKVFGLLTFISWLARKIIFRHPKVREPKIIIPPQFLALVGLGLTGLVSLYFAVSLQPGYVKLGHLIAITVFYLLIVNIVDSPGFIKKVVTVLTISIFLTGFFAIIQRYLLGFRLETQAGLGAVADITEKTLGSVVRSGGFSHPDVLAVILLIAMPLMVYGLHVTRKIEIKSALIIAFIIALMALILTGSRAGILGFFAISFLIMVRRIIRLSPALVIFLTLIVLLAYLLIPQVYWVRLLSLEHYKESFNVSVRKELLFTSYRMFKARWLTGVGIGNFDATLPSYSKAWFVSLPEELVGTIGAHNLFGDVGAEMGIFGLLFFITFLWLTFKNFWTAQKIFKQMNNLEMYILSKALEIGFIGFLIWSQGHAGLVLIKEWWLVTGLAFALKRIAIASKAPKIASVKALADETN